MFGTVASDEVVILTLVLDELRFSTRQCVCSVEALKLVDFTCLTSMKTVRECGRRCCMNEDRGWGMTPIGTRRVCRYIRMFRKCLVLTDGYTQQMAQLSCKRSDTNTCVKLTRKLFFTKPRKRSWLSFKDILVPSNRIWLQAKLVEKNA